MCLKYWRLTPAYLILPDDSDKLGNAAAKLRSHALQEAAKDKSIVAVVAMTRCSAFETNTAEDASTETLERYVYRFTDPTIFFHVSGGAHVRKIVHGYRPEDYDNLGSATFAELAGFGATRHRWVQ